MDLKVLQKFSYGVYLVGSRNSDAVNGQIANSLMQVSAEPPQVAVCIHHQNLTHQYISDSHAFSVSVLAKETPLKFIIPFGFKTGKDTEKFKNVDYGLSNGLPVLNEYCVGYLACNVQKQLDLATHTLFIGEVVDADIKDNSEPLTYSYYHKVKNGKVQRRAPTYFTEL
jgi:flavin reductase (DIM6/NTAB) family NADH-FMN oxidoreductase RutF